MIIMVEFKYGFNPKLANNNNRNVLNVDEPAQLIQVETSVRMTWVDPRLNVTLPADSPTDYVRFGSDVTRHIWFPDVYIDGVKELRTPAYKVNK